MARVRWMPQALDDVASICAFIEKDAPRYAQVFARRILQATDRLELFPRSGRVVPETDQEDLREIILGNYRIIYRIAGEFIQVLTVYHSARLFDASSLPPETGGCGISGEE